MRRHEYLKQGRLFNFALQLVCQRDQPIERVLVPLAFV
jgi:hypothetical protein